MERLNLNVPAETRAELKAMAKLRGKREAELARELLTRALEQEKRALFFEAVRSTITEEYQERLREIASRYQEHRRGESR